VIVVVVPQGVAPDELVGRPSAALWRSQLRSRYVGQTKTMTMFDEDLHAALARLTEFVRELPGNPGWERIAIVEDLVLTPENRVNHVQNVVSLSHCIRTNRIGLRHDAVETDTTFAGTAGNAYNTSYRSERRCCHGGGAVLAHIGRRGKIRRELDRCGDNVQVGRQ